jgi:hypothetical protein
VRRPVSQKAPEAAEANSLGFLVRGEFEHRRPARDRNAESENSSSQAVHPQEGGPGYRQLTTQSNIVEHRIRMMMFWEIRLARADN